MKSDTDNDLEVARPVHCDEAGAIWRGVGARGDNIRDGSSKASIEGGFWLGLLAIIIASAAAAASWYAVGATAGSVYAAQMAERNAKVAQYQLETALDNAGIKHPADLPKENP